MVGGRSVTALLLLCLLVAATVPASAKKHGHGHAGRVAGSKKHGHHHSHAKAHGAAAKSKVHKAHHTKHASKKALHAHEEEEEDFGTTGGGGEETSGSKPPPPSPAAPAAAPVTAPPPVAAPAAVVAPAVAVANSSTAADVFKEEVGVLGPCLQYFEHLIIYDEADPSKMSCKALKGKEAIYKFTEMQAHILQAMATGFVHARQSLLIDSMAAHERSGEMGRAARYALQASRVELSAQCIASTPETDMDEKQLACAKAMVPSSALPASIGEDRRCPMELVKASTDLIKDPRHLEALRGTMCQYAWVYEGFAEGETLKMGSNLFAAATTACLLIKHQGQGSKGDDHTPSWKHYQCADHPWPNPSDECGSYMQDLQGRNELHVCERHQMLVHGLEEGASVTNPLAANLKTDNKLSGVLQAIGPAASPEKVRAINLVRTCHAMGQTAKKGMLALIATRTDNVKNDLIDLVKTHAKCGAFALTDAILPGIGTVASVMDGAIAIQGAVQELAKTDNKDLQASQVVGSGVAAYQGYVDMVNAAAGTWYPLAVSIGSVKALCYIAADVLEPTKYRKERKVKSAKVVEGILMVHNENSVMALKEVRDAKFDEKHSVVMLAALNKANMRVYKFGEALKAYMEKLEFDDKGAIQINKGKGMTAKIKGLFTSRPKAGQTGNLQAIDQDMENEPDWKGDMAAEEEIEEQTQPEAEGEWHEEE